MKSNDDNAKAVNKYSPAEKEMIQRVLENSQKKLLEETTVDVSIIEGNIIQIAVHDVRLMVSAEQAAELLKEIRRAIVKINPKVLRNK